MRKTKLFTIHFTFCGNISGCSNNNKNNIKNNNKRNSKTSTLAVLYIYLMTWFGVIDRINESVFEVMVRVLV